MDLKKNNITEVFGISKVYLADLNKNELEILANKIDTNEIDSVILFKPLILDTESMDDDEKQYWFDILPSMHIVQIIRLLNILITEFVKLQALELKYQQEIQLLNKKHLIEWEEFQLKQELKRKKRLFNSRKRRKGNYRIKS
jgi:hypothetical protein